MRKFWKNLCACSLAVACGLSLAGCGKEDNDNGDLNGDGVVSSWETMFEDPSQRPYYNFAGSETVKYINNAEELLAIGKSETAGGVYILNADIDLGGQSVCINLNGAHLYGGDHVISNFKMHSDDKTASAMSLSTSMQITEALEVGFTKMMPVCLFYNGASVNDLRIFAGVQSLNIQTQDSFLYMSISPLFNVNQISNVDVKGMLDIKATQKEGRSLAKIDASLLYSGMPTATSTIEETSSSVKNVTKIENVNIDGVINFNESNSTQISVDLGAAASRLTEESSLYNANVNVGINAGISEYISNIGGAVGSNKGFVSTINLNSDVNINNSANNSASHEENIGGIVGYNGALGEVKNCKIKGKLNFLNPKQEAHDVQSNYNIGGVVGNNVGGIIELCQMDADIALSNLSNKDVVSTSRCVGGLCGANNRGIISYNICRGSITATNVDELSVAQAVGSSDYGAIEKLITTTTITVDNSDVDIKNCRVNVGMVTTFYSNISNLDNLNTSPTFKKILVDGVTDVLTKAGASVDYHHGLRNKYEYKNPSDIEADPEVILPDIFSDIYYMNTCKFTKRSLVEINGIIAPGNDLVSYNYVTGISEFTQNPKYLINTLDFKNYLNHNEVSIGDKLALNEIQFTVKDDRICRQSYFGNSQYNGDLMYFDREFEESHIHNAELGHCNKDTDDEMLSFINYLMLNTTQSYSCAIKINKSYLDGIPEFGINRANEEIDRFANAIDNIFGCLGLTVNEVEDENLSGGEFKTYYPILLDKFYKRNENTNPKYLRFLVTDIENQKQFTLTFDITNMQEKAGIFGDNYIIYLNFACGMPQN